MKTLIRDRYGPPDVLEVREVERPVPNEREVLVRVHAAEVGGKLGEYEYQVRMSNMYFTIPWGFWLPDFSVTA
jgi:hypothetical protein